MLQSNTFFVKKAFFFSGQKELKVLFSDFEIQRIWVSHSVNTRKEKNTASDMFKTQMQTKSQESINLDIQISETFCSSLSALFPTSSIFWSILFPPIYYPSLSPQQKEQKTTPSQFYQIILPLSFSYTLMYYTSCPGLYSSFTSLSSLIHHHPPSSSHFYPSVFPTPSIFYYISPSHLLLSDPDYVWESLSSSPIGEIDISGCCFY